MGMTLKQILDVKAAGDEPMLPTLPRMEPRPPRSSGAEWLAASAFLFIVGTGCVLVTMVIARALFGQ